MTRSKTKVGEWVHEKAEDPTLISRDTEPPEFTRVQFPVKALKLLLHELQTNGEIATLAGPRVPIDAESDDEVRTCPRLSLYSEVVDHGRFFHGKDSDWSDEEKVRDDRFSYLADVMGPGGLVFDEDDVLVSNDDEDLQKDPISQIDLRVSAIEAALIRISLIRFLLFRRHMSPRLFVRAQRAMRTDSALLSSG